MRTASMRWARLAPLTALTTLLGLLALSAAPAAATPGPASGSARSAQAGAADLTAATTEPEPSEVELTLATLTYLNGVRVVFSYGTTSGDYGMSQTGQMNRNGPVIDGEAGFLDAYLAITPAWVPVPYQLLSAPDASDPLPAELAERTISSTPVAVGDLAVPPTALKSRTCWDLYWDPYHWYEPAAYPEPSYGAHDDKTYYASSFGDMRRFAGSYVGNCGDEPVWHKIYYKSGGVYYPNSGGDDVSPGTWEAIRRGSVHRWRKVVYHWGVGYTRNGRFWY